MVAAARRPVLWTLLICGFAAWQGAESSRAQSAPTVLPASVPAVVGTRDPSAAGPGRVRESFAVITKPAQAARTDATAAPGDPHANVKVKGLTGTLNKGDVHQTMEARQGLFDACIRESRRTLRWVSGSIRYAFTVDGEGRVAELRPLSSTIGHRALERCLTEVVASTQFPKPAGRATAEFSWGMSVEPLSRRAFAEVSPRLLKRLVRKRVREVFGACEIRRRRARFRVTAYLAPSGRLLSSGAVSLPASADDKVDCVLEQLDTWHMPKVKRASKISFELR